MPSSTIPPHIQRLSFTLIHTHFSMSARLLFYSYGSYIGYTSNTRYCHINTDLCNCIDFSSLHIIFVHFSYYAVYIWTYNPHRTNVCSIRCFVGLFIWLMIWFDTITLCIDIWRACLLLVNTVFSSQLQYRISFMYRVMKKSKFL